MTLQADQIKTGVEIGDLFRLVDVDPPNLVPGLPAGIDLRLVSGGSGIKRVGWAFPIVGNTLVLKSSYSRQSVILWSGSTFYGRPPVRAKVVFETDTAGRTIDVRLYDVTNSETIAELSNVTSFDTQTIYTMPTLANVPNTEAVWELQFRRNPGPGVELTCGFVQVEFE